MSIEFRLDRNDHHTIEDFLATRPAHVSAIIVEASNLDRQAIATREITISPFIRLISEDESDGFVMYWPVTDAETEAPCSDMPWPPWT
jgi:hypothetical protein